VDNFYFTEIYFISVYFILFHIPYFIFIHFFNSYSMLRSILGIRWQVRGSNQEVLDRAGLTSIVSLLLKAQLRWSGHEVRMDDNRIPRQLMYSELKEGSRNQGRPRLRYKDTLKNNIKWCNIQTREFETAAADRASWRSTTFKATALFEEDRRQRLEAARDKRDRAALNAIQSMDHRCDTCDRLCASSFGLKSHMRSHR
jgi:hypothetical protein